MRLCKPYRLGRGDLEHAAARWNRSVTQREYYHPACPDQACHPRHAPPSLLLIQMHPDRREHHDVKNLAVLAQVDEIR